MKEVKEKRFAGPFKNPPFSNYHQSPVGLVPKSNRDIRLIFHLSYPRGGKSINSQMPKNLYTVKYKDLTQAIRLCMEAGKSCYVVMVDMKSTFQNLPI